MEVPPALRSTPSQRERQRGVEQRTRPVRLVSAGVLWFGLLLLSADAPPRQIVVTAIIGLSCTAYLGISDQRLRRSPAPLLWICGQHLAVTAVLAYVATWSGGVDSAALWMTIMTALLMGARLPFRWLVATTLLCSTVVVTALTLADLPRRPDADMVGPVPVELLAWLIVFTQTTVMAFMLAHGERRARREGHRDALTGVLNRAALEARLTERHAPAAPDHAPLSVIAADLDGFKLVNDTHGHHAGDLVLRAVASTLTDRLRPGDLLYRSGGDEFIIVLPNTTDHTAAAVAERLRSAVNDLRPEGHDVRLSLGVASDNQPPHDLQHLISRADRALYAAKGAGRDCVRLDEARATVQPAGRC